MATTYEAIATTTVGTATSAITFSSIAASWTDLRVVLNILPSAAYVGVGLRLNAATTNYSNTYIEGNGSAASSGRNSNADRIYCGAGNNTTTERETYLIDIFSYANGTFKTALIGRSGKDYTTRTVGLYRSTSAINQVNLISDNGNFDVGTTATLYGIKAA